MSDPIVLQLTDVVRTYHLGKVDVPALRGVSLEVRRGEFLAIVGPSGSGKTTLLNLAGMLDRPDAGEVYLGGEPTTRLPEKARARMRRERVGFIFQSFNLMPHLTAEENVALPLRYGDGQGRLSPTALLARVGLGERANHKPAELSGGEQQRVAIARALVLNPPIILADEPTGELDSETASDVHQVLDRLRAAGKAVVVVTHNPELESIAERTVHMRDGLISEDVDRRSPSRSPAKRTARAKSTDRAKPSARAKPTAGAKPSVRAKPAPRGKRTAD